MAEIHDISAHHPHFRVPMERTVLVLPVDNIRRWVRSPAAHEALIQRPLLRAIVREWFQIKTGECIEYDEHERPLVDDPAER